MFWTKRIYWTFGRKNDRNLFAFDAQLKHSDSPSGWFVLDLLDVCLSRLHTHSEAFVFVLFGKVADGPTAVTGLFLT